MEYTEETDIENLIRLLYSGTLTQYGKRKLIDYLRKLEEQVEYDKTHIFTPQTIKFNYIPKEAIRNKIKDYDNAIEDEFKKCKNKAPTLALNVLTFTKDEFKELLGE